MDMLKNEIEELKKTIEESKKAFITRSTSIMNENLYLESKVANLELDHKKIGCRQTILGHDFRIPNAWQ